MTLRRWYALVVIVCALTATSTRGGQPPSTAARENAYRANNLGVALLEQFKFDEAAAAFQEALRLAPDLGLAHLNLSLALFQARDIDGAKTEAAAAERLLPESPQPPYILGLLAREENRDGDATRFFTRVRQIDPHDVGTAVNLAQIAIQDRRYEEAIALLRPAVADEPYNITAVYNLGLAMTRSGQREEGQRLMENSQTLRTTGYGTTLSSAYLEQGKYAEAIASTGAEPELVDRTRPAVVWNFVPVARSSGSSSAASPASPFGRRFGAADLAPDGVRRIAAALGGGLTMIDADGDGDLDIVIADADGVRLFRNDGGRFTDVTVGSGLANAPAGSVPVGCVAGDIDNDGAPDLFVLRYGTNTIYRNDGHGRFTDVTARSGIKPFPFLPGAAALVDVDHDGDLDLVVAGLADIDGSRARAAERPLVFPNDFAAAPLLLMRNNGDGTFTDTTAAAKLVVATHAVAIVPTDFDNHRDIDLLVVSADRVPILFKNLRDGSFADVATEVGLGAADFAGATSVAAADVNKDGYPDFFFGRGDRPGVLAMSDRRGHFTIAQAPESSRGAIASQFFDYDNDGLLDLLTWADTGPHVARNLGTSWEDVTASVLRDAGAATVSLPSARALAVGDVDGDARDDVVARSSDGSVAALHATDTGTNRAVRVRLKGRVSNRTGVGAKVEIRAGSLDQRIETSAATPAIAPADLIFGLGARAGADVARVLWPSGILQAEFAGAAASGSATPVTPTPLPNVEEIEELNRKPSSCPFLYTSNGGRFEFVTDFMGGGEMGYREDAATYNHPNPIEFVRIRDDQLRARNGRYELRVTNELEETLFVDRLQLIAIAHPADVDVFPNEGMADPPKPFHLFAVKDQRTPAKVIDDVGRDVTESVAALDRRYAEGFRLETIRGYAATHRLEIDLGGVPDRPVLLLTGWTDYAFSSDNVAARQAGLTLTPPSLDVRDASGGWRPAVSDIGIPVGRPQTIVVDLAALLGPGEQVVRVSTNMRIYWDRIAVASAVDPSVLRQTTRDPESAELHERGFSAEVRPDDTDPPVYDYGRVTQESPWKIMPGLYTREGDVRSLVSASDDMFVIAKPGDEIALGFRSAPPLPSGWRQTFLLMGDGFSKEMDVNSASPDRVDPLPFHAMSRYPYSPPEKYPTSARYQRYRASYNTRRVASELSALVSSRDASAARRSPDRR